VSRFVKMAALENLTTSRVTPLYAQASVKSTVQLYVQTGVTLSISETKTDGDCKFGLSPGGWALLEGKFPEPKWASGASSGGAKKAAAPSKKAAAPSKKGGKMLEKGMIVGKWVFGPYQDATEETKQITREFTFENGIPERAWSALSVKVTADEETCLFSGGLNRKGREHVYVLTPQIIDPYTCKMKVFKRLYPHEIPKEAEGFSWKDNLTIQYTVRIPKEEVESEDESEGGNNALLGGDDSSSDDDSSS